MFDIIQNGETNELRNDKSGGGKFKAKGCRPTYNKEKIKEAIDCAEQKGTRLIVLPELCVTGYTCADLFFTKSLQHSAENALKEIIEYTSGKNIVAAVGMPVPFYNSLYNCAVVIGNGRIYGIVPKIHLANYNEFYEKRWFASGSDFKSCQNIDFCGFETTIGSQIFDLGGGAVLGLELCEDLWVPTPPSGSLTLSGANIIANLSASDEYVSKAQYRRPCFKSVCTLYLCICLFGRRRLRKHN